MKRIVKYSNILTENLITSLYISYNIIINFTRVERPRNIFEHLFLQFFALFERMDSCGRKKNHTALKYRSVI